MYLPRESGILLGYIVLPSVAPYGRFPSTKLQVGAVLLQSALQSIILLYLPSTDDTHESSTQLYFNGLLEQVHLLVL